MSINDEILIKLVLASGCDSWIGNSIRRMMTLQNTKRKEMPVF